MREKLVDDGGEVLKITRVRDGGDGVGVVGFWGGDEEWN